MNNLKVKTEKLRGIADWLSTDPTQLANMEILLEIADDLESMASRLGIVDSTIEERLAALEAFAGCKYGLTDEQLAEYKKTRALDRPSSP